MTSDDELLICRSSRLCLKLSFLWPLKKEELNSSKWFYLRLMIFITATFVSCFIPVLMHLFKSLDAGIDISEDLSVIAAYIGIHVIMVLYIVKQKKTFELMVELSNFEKYGKPRNFDRINKKLNFYTMAIYIYAFVGTIIYNGIKIVQIPQCREEKGFLEVCGLIFAMWLPFNPDSWASLSLLIFYIFVLIVTADKITVLVSMQLLEMTINMKLRIDQLNSMIVTWFDGDRVASQKRLVECIHYHNLIISLSEKLNDCFTHGMFAHISTTGVICGCLENQIIKEQNVGSIIHIGGWIASLYVACLAGQILMDASLSVSDAVYKSKWYEADVQLRKHLILMIKRSQKPFFIKAGPYNFLCYALFLAIMKLSYSILTLLN